MQPARPELDVGADALLVVAGRGQTRQAGIDLDHLVPERRDPLRVVALAGAVREDRNHVVPPLDLGLRRGAFREHPPPVGVRVASEHEVRCANRAGELDLGRALAPFRYDDVEKPAERRGEGHLAAVERNRHGHERRALPFAARGVVVARRADAELEPEFLRPLAGKADGNRLTRTREQPRRFPARSRHVNRNALVLDGLRPLLHEAGIDRRRRVRRPEAHGVLLPGVLPQHDRDTRKIVLRRQRLFGSGTLLRGRFVRERGECVKGRPRTGRTRIRRLHERLRHLGANRRVRLRRTVAHRLHRLRERRAERKRHARLEALRPGAVHARVARNEAE